MRIRETRTVDGGLGGGRLEERVRVVAQTDLVPADAEAVADTTELYDWREVTIAAPDSSTVLAGSLSTKAGE